MDTEDIFARTVRLTRIPYYLQTHPKGLTTDELAKLCGVCRRTIQRDMNTLQVDLRLPVIIKNHHYILVGDYILPPVSFSLYESVALFMASRLALRQADERNPHLQTALLKMAKVLPYPLDEKVQSGAAFIGTKKSAQKYVINFEKIAFAWMAQRKVIIYYHSMQSDEFHIWELEPYFMEMTGVGYSSYVIGHATRADKDGVFTFKLDRIKKVRLTIENFEIPVDIDIEKLLSRSWGVIWGNDIEVVLKFSPAVTRRVKESIWHPSQVISDLKGGGCSLKLKVGSLMEITPWIRSWGPDVEVLEPESLRTEFVNYAQRLAEIYESNEINEQTNNG